MDNSNLNAPERDRLGSRLGFILLSAGCAIGLGNVWKFPDMVGANGGGLFVLIISQHNAGAFNGQLANFAIGNGFAVFVHYRTICDRVNRDTRCARQFVFGDEPHR